MNRVSRVIVLLVVSVQASVVDLAGPVAREGVGVGSAAEQEEDPLRLIGSSSARERKRGLRLLVKQEDGERVWERVVDGLDDPAPDVAEQAEMLLASGGPFAHEVLLGTLRARGTSAVARVRCCSALAQREEPVTPSMLLPALEARAPTVRAAALVLLQRHLERGGAEGTAELRRRLERLARERSRGKTKRKGRADADRIASIEARARALYCMLLLGAEHAERELERAWRDPDPALRAAARAVVAESAAVDSGRRLSQPLLDAAVRSGLEDEDWRARAAALQLAVELASADALSGVVECMTSDPRPGLQERALDALQRRSGLRHDAREEPWRAWLRSGARPVRRDTIPSAEGERTIAFAEIALRSDRVAFLVDLSGSMGQARAGGRTRKDAVEERLSELFARSPGERHFLLVPFSTEPHPWNDRPVPSTKRNVREAMQAFKETRAGGAGDLWEALAWVRAEPGIDSIVLLTDGVPTGGAYNRMGLLTERFRQRNLVAQQKLDVYLIEPSTGARRAWQAFCERNGGACRTVRLHE